VFDRLQVLTVSRSSVIGVYMLSCLSTCSLLLGQQRQRFCSAEGGWNSTA